MARRSSPSRGSSSFGRGRSPNRRAAPAPPPKAVAPQAPPASQVGQPAMAAPGGGLMAQVASTAAGVAIGHTIGHAITGSMMGGGSQSEQGVEPQQQQQLQPQSASQYQQPQQYQQNQQQEPCRFEMEQFLSCAQTQSNDLTLCEGFNQVLRECKTRYGHMYQ